MSQSPTPSEGHPALDELHAAEGDLPPRIQAHLSECPQCRVEARLLGMTMSRRGEQGLDPAVSRVLDGCRRSAVKSITSALSVASSTYSIVIDSQGQPRSKEPSVDPKRLQDYENLRWLGAGTAGVSYASNVRTTRWPVALKVLHDHVAITDELKERIRKITELRHPNVGGLGELVEQDDVRFLPMEWVNGKELNHRRLSIDDAKSRSEWRSRGPLRRLFWQLAVGLSVLHETGLCHGNLKPTNVRIDRSDRVVLLDAAFGGLIAAPRGPAASFLALPYQAPECSDGTAMAPSQDWYSFGVLLHEALTGRLPSPGDTGPSRGESRDADDLFALCRALISADPSSRPGDSTVLRQLGSPPAHSAALRYRDLGLIAHGGMAEVRRVEDSDLRRSIAMKLLGDDVSDASSERERFLIEARVTAQLVHPGIVAIHELGTLPDGRPYFTMEEVRGKTFAEVIHRVHQESNPSSWRRDESGWTFRKLVDAFLRVCETISFAHSKGIAHRDLKPANIMVGAFGEVMVLDWGLAKLRGTSDVALETGMLDPESEPDAGPGLTRQGQVAGTPSYMPPEQARGALTELGPRSDVYSLGAVLYEILTGRPPYQGDSAIGVISQVLSGPPAPPSEPPEGAQQPPPIPHELEGICSRAMSRSPRDRYSDAAELAQAVSDWLEGAKRRERALSLVNQAQAASPELASLRSEAATLRSSSKQMLENLPTWAPVDQKRPAWELQAKAARLERDAALKQVELEQYLHAALSHEPHLPEALDLLSDHHARLLREAEEQDQPTEAARHEALLRAYDRGRYVAFLAGGGRLTLKTEPSGARVTFHRYESVDQRLSPVPTGQVETTPIVGMPLRLGSYLLEVHFEGRASVSYPVEIRRQDQWDGLAPGDTEPTAIRLLARGEVHEDEVYVPAGWFRAGGDSKAPSSGPSQRLWCDAFVMKRFAVSNAEYLSFLNDLVTMGRESAALQFAPREQGQPVGDPRGHIYHRAADGRFFLGADSEGDVWQPDWPVFLIDWYAASAYGAWLAERSALPWRLPHELEWEKAARGVDGRVYPWGSGFDASYCRTRLTEAGGNLPAPVHSHPIDASPYGVRGLAGNVGTWCANDFRAPLPTTDSPRVVPSSGSRYEDWAPARRGGSWRNTELFSRAARRASHPPGEVSELWGIRLVRSIPLSERSG